MIIGLGTLYNVLGIVLGGIIGFYFGKTIKPGIQMTLMAITGVAVIFFGIGGTLEKMLVIVNNGTGRNFAMTGAVMMIVSLALGAIIGEILDLEGKIRRFGSWLQEKSKNSSDSGFIKAFVTASCTVCIGAMAVIGSIQDGISGDYHTLLIKGILDAIIICIMTASQGKGCIFSAVPVAVFQGTITIIAFFAGSFMPEQAISNLAYVGSVLIFCVGLNLIRDKYISVANLLPSIVIAALWGCF